MSLKRINKTQLVDLLIAHLQDELEQAEQAAQQAMEGAIHDQSKAETQYDTLGLEHAYLAEGQSRRIAELKDAITRVQHMAIAATQQDDAVVLGTILLIESQEGQQTVFLSPSGGGKKLQTHDLDVMVITPQSPLGEELLGRYEGDEFKWPSGQNGLIAHIA